MRANRGGPIASVNGRMGARARLGRINAHLQPRRVGWLAPHSGWLTGSGGSLSFLPLPVEPKGGVALWPLN